MNPECTFVYINGWTSRAARERRRSLLSLGVCDQCNGQFVRRTSERIKHVRALFARGREHRPDDGEDGCAGPTAKAVGYLLLHLFGPHAPFRQILGGQNVRIYCEA
ncbi:MAG: hypothetical protein OXC62_08150 [Aestuariivita sp.]|nr:hypothetical protein [Aestuariivita sp.]